MAYTALGFQKAVFEAVKAAVPGTKIYDHIPDSEAYPYIFVGDAVSDPLNTATYDGQTHGITIQVFSNYKGVKQAQEIMGQIYDALHKVDLSIEGGFSGTCRFGGSTSFRDPEIDVYRVIHNYSLIAS